MHSLCLWPHERKWWLILYPIAFCVVLWGLVGSVFLAQNVGDASAKWITCVLVSVVCTWSIGVFISVLWRKRPGMHETQEDQLLRWKLMVFVSASVLQIVNCVVATWLPLSFEVYLPISSY